MANSDDPVAFSFNGSTVYDSDIQTLAPEEWVGDAIIMLLFSLLEEEAHSSDIELWSPAVVQLLCTTDESSLDPSTASSLFPPKRKINILPSNFVVIKFWIHRRREPKVSDAYASDSSTMSSHWSLLLIYSPPSSSHTTAYHFDSMEPHNAHAAARCNANFASAFDRMPTQIRAVGQGGWSTTSDQGDAGAGAVLQSQENAWDCGVYVLALTNGLVHHLSQSSIGGGRDERAQLERVISEVVEANGSPAFIESWRSSFCAWVRKWQEEANGGGGVWDKMEEVVEALGPWAPHE
ncbi:hypothetical protein OC861_005467 [Tilletia horrida]|nr:hypothetical protein OC861_005467 [Tilletia horrida]